MINTTSPLATLAAFVIVLAVGVISSATLVTYIGNLRAKVKA